MNFEIDRDIEEGVRRYRDQSIRYLGNAFRAIEAKDAGKAGEFIWGSMAEALKALALSRGIDIERHAQIEQYSRAIAKQLKGHQHWGRFWARQLSAQQLLRD